MSRYRLRISRAIWELIAFVVLVLLLVGGCIWLLGPQIWVTFHNGPDNL